MKRLLIILLPLALVGGGGYLGWNYYQDSKTNNSITDPSEGGKYLVIKEWDARFMLPDELRGDVKHGIFTFNNGAQAIYFASKKLAAKSQNGSCDLKQTTESNGQGFSGGTIAVSRSKTEPEVIDDRSFNEGSYWYTLGFSNGGACYEGDTGQEKGTFNSLVSDAVKRLEPL